MRSFAASALSLALVGPLAVSAASGSGKSTRYWDCCKPSCAWNDKAAVSAPVTTCDKNDNPISDVNAQSGCNGGSAYTCSNNSPWAVNDNLAYGFAATKLSGGSENSWCCGCYAVTFTSGAVKGKTMIVQSTNTGGDLGENHFDLQMPGGGVGIFDGCKTQWGGLGGAQYGGISSRSECDSFPELLKDGCYWRFDWFMNADNPDLTFEQVQCPKALTDISGCKRSDDSSFPAYKGDTTSSNTKAVEQKPSTTAAAAATSKAVEQKSSTAAAAATSKAAEGEKEPTVEDKSSAAPAVTQTSAAAGEEDKTPVTDKPAPTTTKTRGGPNTRTSKVGCGAPKASQTVSAEGSASSAVAMYFQCNGSKDAFPNGELACVQGSKCVYANDYYSQCVPI